MTIIIEKAFVHTILDLIFNQRWIEQRNVNTGLIIIVKREMSLLIDDCKRRREKEIRGSVGIGDCSDSITLLNFS